MGIYYYITMGGKQTKAASDKSKLDTDESLLHTVNNIWGNYISTSSFKNHLHLIQTDKCNNLLKIIVAALDKHLSVAELTAIKTKLNITIPSESAAESSAESTAAPAAAVATKSKGEYPRVNTSDKLFAHALQLKQKQTPMLMQPTQSLMQPTQPQMQMQ